MDIENPYALFALLVRIAVICVIMLYLFPRQMKEVARPKNEFTRLRWYLLTLLGACAVTMVPTAPRLFQLIQTPPENLLSIVSTVSSSVCLAAFLVILVLVFTYKEQK